MSNSIIDLSLDEVIEKYAVLRGLFYSIFLKVFNRSKRAWAWQFASDKKCTHLKKSSVTILKYHIEEI